MTITVQISPAVAADLASREPAAPEGADPYRLVPFAGGRVELSDLEAAELLAEVAFQAGPDGPLVDRFGLRMAYARLAGRLEPLVAPEAVAARAALPDPAPADDDDGPGWSPVLPPARWYVHRASFAPDDEDLAVVAGPVRVELEVQARRLIASADGRVLEVGPVARWSEVVASAVTAALEAAG